MSYLFSPHCVWLRLHLHENVLHVNPFSFSVDAVSSPSSRVERPPPTLLCEKRCSPRPELWGELTLPTLRTSKLYFFKVDFRTFCYFTNIFPICCQLPNIFPICCQHFQIWFFISGFQNIPNF